MQMEITMMNNNRSNSESTTIIKRWTNTTRLKLENHFYQASRTIKDWEASSVNNHIILSKSIDDYLAYKPISTRRLYISLTITICQYIGAFCFAYLIFHNTPSTWIAFGTTYHLLGPKNARNAHVLNFFTYIFGATTRIAMIRCEQRHRCDFFSILKRIGSETRGGLEDRYFKKICRRMKLCGTYAIRFYSMISASNFVMQIFFGIFAYWFESKVDDSPLRLTLFVIISSFLVWQTMVTIPIGFLSITSLVFTFSIDLIR